MLQGPSTALYKDILGAVKINLIASGGIVSFENIEALKEAGCEGGLLGKLCMKVINPGKLGKVMLKRQNNSLLDIKDGRTVKV